MKPIKVIDYLEREYGTAHSPIERYLVNCGESNMMRRDLETHRNNTKGRINEIINEYNLYGNVGTILSIRNHRRWII